MTVQVMVSGRHSTPSPPRMWVNTARVPMIVSSILSFVLGSLSSTILLTNQITPLHFVSDEPKVTDATTRALSDDGGSATIISDGTAGETTPPVPAAAAAAAKPAATPLDRFRICETSSKGWEPIMESLMGMVFHEHGFLPTEGQILDVGAQMGEQACRCALLAPDRQVIAMDPSPEQIEKIRSGSKFSNELPNLRLIQSGIGSEPTNFTITQQDVQMEGGGGFTGLRPGDTFEVTTIDRLFFEQGQKLAFAHIDVEGRELDTLKGGKQTILDNYPVFTTELRVHRDPNFTKALLDFLDMELGYDSYVIEEVCGWPHMDFRNLLNIPRKRLSKSLQYSDTFTFALASELIW
eukprot:CAMPEP_0113444108 /NCGR_PEP_ID=MMETSP0014_2-20120614/2497_1 /TAXON_ID=2857 /ORGANISM="Nitzschia sp." /LENGTH=350 /DNA_ID=CAMNT_0000335111 /DNA_START=41 /DNA_END=1090 /DNA_ORIENTATION=- /assembly_acc=CAM_ASM_000159